MVSFVGMAGNGEFVSLFLLHPQSLPHSQTVASGLQQHFFAFNGFDEQQLVCTVCSAKPPQHVSTDSFASTDACASQVHPAPELKSDGCTPIATVANIINVATKMGRLVLSLRFMDSFPAQIIVGWSDRVKANGLLSTQYMSQQCGQNARISLLARELHSIQRTLGNRNQLTKW